MDHGGRRTSKSNRESGNLSSYSYSVTSCDLWHSTPVKKETSNVGASVEEPSPVSTSVQHDGQKMAGQSTRSSNGLNSTDSLYTRTPSRSLPLLQDRQSLGEMESAIILRQRHELQLLIADLKDRDQELNTMAAAHHKQVTAWEQDRQRVLTLEQRCSRLEDELKKRNEVIRAVTKRVHVVEAREKEGQREHTSTLQQLLELGQKHQNAIQHCHDLEEKNQSLNSTVMSLSAQLGSLQVREEELRAMLRLKDTDVTEATNHILDLSGRVREMEGSLKESHLRETKALREADELKRRYRDVRHDNSRLKEELEQLVAEGSAQREDVIRLKQEGQLLRRELAMSGDGQSWKDELLGLARSKQERTEAELHCLRQVCENQQNDLQLLKLNLESTREALTQAEGQRSPSSQGELTCVHLDSPSPSSRSRRSLGHKKDSNSPAATHQQSVDNSNLGDILTVLENEDQFSSTNRLQRLLAESRQMVASLERTTLQPLSPSHSPASNVSQENHSCDPEKHNHITPHQYLNETPPPTQTTRSSQTSRDSDTPPRNTQVFQRNLEVQLGVEHLPEHARPGQD
ncbi:coiled-coil domain-containing protein 62 isoform X2 [Esox lucius]|uniref:coiled-coil domain-containing protein 62 isoform X2 n=1 Tax=Esox lucius TaxID=8010 RepID=UPI000576548D|nr:coiled-coil domain-containing protein 62 isoform X2 [Esox lucius]